jgi:outer membrane protein
MKLTNILLFTLVFVATLPSFAQTQLSIKDAIQYAMQNNISIKNSQINIADAEARIYENRATGLPQVSASFDWQTFFLIPKVKLPFSPEPIAFQQRHSLTPGVSASQLVYSGSYNVARRAAREYRDLVQKQLTVKQNEVKNQVIDAYLPALLITESVKTFDKNIINLEKLLNETKAFNKEGFVENLDVDRLTLSLENIKTQRANIFRSKELVVNALRFVIGAKNTETFELKDDLTSLLSDVNQADLEGEINYTKRPEYNLIVQGEKMQQLQIDLAKASTLPTVATFASLSYGFQGNGFGKDAMGNKEYFFLPTGVVGAKISVPIWAGGGLPYTKQRAVLALETVKNQRLEFENAVQLQVKNARIAYSNAKINLASQEKNLGLAEKIYNISKTKYKEGIGSSVEIIQAEGTLYQNQQNIIQARYDLLKAKIDLDKALGN